MVLELSVISAVKHSKLFTGQIIKKKKPKTWIEIFSVFMVKMLSKAGSLHYIVVTDSSQQFTQFWVTWYTQDQLPLLAPLFAPFSGQTHASHRTVSSLKIFFSESQMPWCWKEKKKYRSYKEVSIRCGFGFPQLPWNGDLAGSPKMSRFFPSPPQKNILMCIINTPLDVLWHENPWIAWTLK